MSNTLILNQRRDDVGLQTATYTIPTGGAGLYYVECVCTEVPPSGISIVVNQNGTPVFTAPSVSPTQIQVKFKYAQLYADADVITVVFSSSAANDQLLNTVKSSLSIGQGA